MGQRPAQSPAQMQDRAHRLASTPRAALLPTFKIHFYVFAVLGTESRAPARGATPPASVTDFLSGLNCGCWAGPAHLAPGPAPHLPGRGGGGGPRTGPRGPRVTRQPRAASQPRAVPGVCGGPRRGVGWGTCCGWDSPGRPRYFGDLLGACGDFKDPSLIHPFIAHTCVGSLRSALAPTPGAQRESLLPRTRRNCPE